MDLINKFTCMRNDWQFISLVKTNKNVRIRVKEQVKAPYNGEREKVIQFAWEKFAV